MKPDAKMLADVDWEKTGKMRGKCGENAGKMRGK
jgi:hypothetical protein